MPNYPGSLDDDVSLYLAVNNARTRLTSSISISDLTIPVVTTSGFPNQGFVTILSNPDDITEAEAIRYVGVSETTFSGVERGAGGTPIFAHGTNDNVDLTVMAEHHNELKDAVIEIEKILGISGSLNFVPKDAQGNAIVSGTLTAENLFEAGWITVSGSLVVCGEAQFKDDVLFEQDVNVSGCLQVGGPDVSSDPGFYFSSDEGPTDTSTTTTDTSVHTSNFTPSSGKHLILFRGNVGGRSASTNDAEIKARYNGVDMGFSRGDGSNGTDGPWANADLAGWKLIDANGVSTPEIFIRNANSGTLLCTVGTMSFLSIPLDEMGLVENTDYFISNGSDTEQNSGITSAYTTYTDSTLNFTVTKPGQYLMLGYAENETSINSLVRFRLDGGTQNYQLGNNQNRYKCHPFARIVTLTAGAHTADAQFNNNSAFNATTDARRGRVAFIYLGFFNQAQGIRSTADLVTSANAFVEYTHVTANFQPQVQSQVLLLGQTAHQTADNASATTWQFKNETTGDTYQVDAGQRIHTDSGFGVPAGGTTRGTWLFQVLENQTADYEWKMETREPSGNGDNQTIQHVFFMQMSNALPAGPPVIDYTLIKEDKISTPSICVDNLDVMFDAGVSGTLTIREGLTTATGTFTDELNAPGTAFLGDTNIDWLTVTGTSTLNTLCVTGDADFKGDVAVSGTAKFGQPAPVAAYGDVIFASNDTEQSTTSTSLVDTNCETTALVDGVEYLVIYAANAGNSSTSGKTEVRVEFGGTKYGTHFGLKSNLGTFGANHYNDSHLNGIFKVTGDGSSTVKFRFEALTGATTAYVGAQSIICVPLDQLTEGTDYYYGTTGDTSDTYTTTNVAIQDPPNTTHLSSTFNSMAAGDWLFFWSTEQTSGNFTGRGWMTRFQVDGNDVGSSTYSRNNDNSSGDVYTWAAANTVNIPTGGNITCEILVSSIASSEADFRRGRIFAINTAAFNQVVSTKDSTGLTTNSTGYVDFMSKSITPSQSNSPIIILSSATTYTQNSNSAANHRIRNETDGTNFRLESGERDTATGGGGSDNTSAIFMAHFEERTAATEYRHQVRSAVSGDVSVGRNDNDSGGEPSELILWEFTPATPFVPITQTCIDDDEIQTGTLIADTITGRQSLTISGVAVHAGSPLTVEELNAGTLTVTGTSCVDDLDVKGDLTVSGTAKFGQDNTVPTGNESIIFASQDTEQTTSSTSFVDANCETAPLSNGVEYLIIYTGNLGNSSTSSNEMKVSFGTTKIAGVGFAKSALGTFGNNHHNSAICHGIYRATGNGTDTVKFEFLAAASATSYAGAMAITCIPLDQFTQNTDWFYVENTNDDNADVVDAAITDPPTTTLLSSTFNSMSAGDWIFIWSSEADVDAGTTRGATMRLLVDSSNPGVSRYTFQGRSTGVLVTNSVSAAHVINVPSTGNIPVEIAVASTGFNLSDHRRGRIFAINASLFENVVSSVDNTGFTTNATTFQDFTGINTTISPSKPDAPVIILTSATTYTEDNNSGMTGAIRNETAGSNYRIDSGGREAERGGIGSSDINLGNNFMVHYEARSAETEYRYQIRSVGGGNVTIGKDENASGGEHSEMILWEFTPTGSPFVPITQTCIDDDAIQTGSLVGDTVQARVSLTISGAPVSTGTIGGDAGFVLKTGDDMSGNLDMAGNNVYNAGTVAMQDDTPVVVTSGLLWFDTDAPGHGTHGSAQLPGGMLAATLTSSSGIAVPDAVFKDDIPWDTVLIDNGGWYDPAFPQRLTVPSGILYAQVYANVNFDAENSQNRRQIRIYRNGNTSDNVAEDNQQSILNATYYPTLRAETPVLTVSGGDYFQLSTDINTNGGDLDILASGTNFGILAIDTRGIPGVNSVNLLQGDVNVVAGSGIQVVADSQSNQIEVKLAEETRDLQVWNPDAVPTSGTGTPFSAEWNDGTIGSAGFTIWNVGGNLTTNISTRAGALRLRHTPSSGAADLAGLYRPAPTNNFTIFTKFFILNNRSEDFREFGILLASGIDASPSTANVGSISVPAHHTGTDPDSYYFGFASQHFNAYNSFDRNIQFHDIQFPANDPIYLKVHVNTSTRVVTAHASRDGLIWGAPITGDFSGDFPGITEIGYWINAAKGPNTPLTIQTDFFRVIDGIDDTVPLRGNFVTISGVPQAIVVATGTQTGGGGSGDGNITDINAQEGPSVTVTGVGLVDVITDNNVLTITGTAVEGINTQFGPEVTVTGAGSVEVITTANVLTVSGTTAGSLTDINAQGGPSITITGSAGIGVITEGNVITIDGSDVQGSGATISGCYTHVQSSASSTWNVAHNLSSVPVNYIVLDNSNVEVIPDTFTVNDGDNVTITFAVPQAGTADIFPCISGTGSPVGETEGTATISGCYSHVQTVGSGTWTVDHGLSTEMVNYILLDDTGSQFQPDDFTVVTPDQVTFDFVSDRTGIANIFACTSGTVTFQGGHFSNIVAVTGTFTSGLTVGEGTTYITGSGIDTPELKIAGETPSFGGGSLEYIDTYVTVGASPGGIPLPTGYRAFELHIEHAQHVGVNAVSTLEYRAKTDTTDNYFSGTINMLSIQTYAQTSVSVSSDSQNDRGFMTDGASAGMSNTADRPFSGIFRITNPGSATAYAQFTYEGGNIGNNGLFYYQSGSGMRQEKDRLNAILIRLNDANDMDMTVHLYGYPE